MLECVICGYKSERTKEFIYDEQLDLICKKCKK